MHKKRGVAWKCMAASQHCVPLLVRFACPQVRTPLPLFRVGDSHEARGLMVAWSHPPLLRLGHVVPPRRGLRRAFRMYMPYLYWYCAIIAYLFSMPYVIVVVVVCCAVVVAPRRLWCVLRCRIWPTCQQVQFYR